MKNTSKLVEGKPYEGFYTILLWFGTPLKNILRSKAIYIKNFVIVEHGKIERVGKMLKCEVQGTSFSLKENDIRSITGANSVSLL